MESPVYQSPINTPHNAVRYATDRKDLVMAGVLLVLSMLAANSVLLTGYHLGFAVSFVALAISGTVYLWLCGRWKLSGYSLFCLIGALAGAGVCIWHNDTVTLNLLYMAILYLFMQSLVYATDSAHHDSGTVGSVSDVLYTLIVQPLRHLGASLPALLRIEREGTVAKRRCGAVILGLCCALPVVGILLPLLIEADAAFEGLMQHTVLDNLGEVVLTVMAGSFLFALIFTRLFSLRHQMRPAPANTDTSPRGVDRMALNAFLGVIAGVFTVFLLSQLAYFSSAFAGILPEEYTVAQYARRGFFEMCIICAINLTLVAVTLYLSKKEAGKAPRSTRGLCLSILLFSLGMVAVSLAKMWLYVDSFGMTRLRVLTSVFMVMLGAVLIYVTIRLFVVRFPYMRACVITLTLIGLTVAYADVDTMIARYNVHAYRSGALDTVDVYQLANLSDGAVPYLLELCDDTDEDLARAAIERCYYKLPAEISTDIRAYSVDEQRARQLLLERREELESRFGNRQPSPPSTDANHHVDRDELLADYLKEYATTSTIDYLGEVPLRDSRKTASVYRAYYPDEPSYASVVLDDYEIFAHNLCKPYEIGIYIVGDGGVDSLEAAYMYNIVYIEDVYHLLPTEMRHPTTVTAQTTTVNTY